MTADTLPVAIIGAGPIGLAAAVHLLKSGLTPIIFEASSHVGASIRQWEHVQMFSPWSFNIDEEAVKLLAPTGWVAPQDDTYPTGRELLSHYLQPLAEVPQIQHNLQLNSKVLAVSRSGYDLMKTNKRSQSPFLLRISNKDGEHDVLASAVIDASGTYLTPNWIGSNGLPALNEHMLKKQITYGVPNILGNARQRYANRRVLVVGSGHSALNALNDLATLTHSEPNTKALWAIRSTSPAYSPNKGGCGQLAERDKLGLKIHNLLSKGDIELFKGIKVDRISSSQAGLRVHYGEQTLPVVDEIIVATGFRPNLQLLAELRLELDPATQSPVRLAPMINPDQHSCGSVPSHGVIELSHPEEGVFIVGMKSYGRAPTFLMQTGYEQVRSIAAALASGVSNHTRMLR